jgi:hypothetical protein
MTQEQINGMVAKLAERMKANPDDLQRLADAGPLLQDDGPL